MAETLIQNLFEQCILILNCKMPGLRLIEVWNTVFATEVMLLLQTNLLLHVNNNLQVKKYALNNLNAGIEGNNSVI